MRRMARRYADEPDYKREVDQALGVYHVPRCEMGTCEGCDKQTEKENAHMVDGLLGDPE